MFKSYYVVWKHEAYDEMIRMEKGCLNRTM